MVLTKQQQWRPRGPGHRLGRGTSHLTNRQLQHREGPQLTKLNSEGVDNSLNIGKDGDEVGRGRAYRSPT